MFCILFNKDENLKVFKEVRMCGSNELQFERKWMCTFEKKDYSKYTVSWFI